MARPIHFEIDALDPQRSAKFYEGVFGWKVEKWQGPTDYWLFTTGPAEEGGIDGAVAMREGDRPTTVNTIGVESIDDALALVTKHGGKITTPKHPIPGVGYFAYCEDTEGVPFGVMQSNPEAG